MLVHDLAQWVRKFDAAAIPPRVIEKTKAHVLDSLGCAFGALEEPAPKGTIRAVRAMGGTPECTVIGTSDRTSMTNAVLVNGLLVRDLDLNDMGFGSGGGAGHPSNNIPVALAAGERMDASGRGVVAAIVLGYEVARRLPSAEDQWDSTSGAGLVGAVMAGWLLGLPEDRLAEAFALTVAHCHILGIVRRGQLSAAKSLSGAMASQIAATSVLLAVEGVTGPPTALEESASATRGGADLAGLTAPLGGDFGIMEVGLKAHPCIGTMQTAVEAALRVRAKLKEPPGEIERVEVRMADTPFVSRQVADTERRNPTTRETADHSFPFLAAVALLDGTLTVHSFENERWNDPAVRALMQRTTIEADPALNKYLPGAWPAAVRVITRGGGDYLEEVPHHPGHVKNFMTPAQVRAKFNRFSAEAVPQAQREAIIAEVTELERAPSIRTLMKLVGRTS